MGYEEDDFDVDSDSESHEYTEYYKNILDKLPLNKFYQIINNESTIDIQPVACKGYAHYQTGKEVSLYKLCMKLQHKLFKFSGVKDQCNDIADKKFCDYINYWLRDEMYKIDADSSGVTFLGTIFNMFKSKLPDPNCSYNKYDLQKNDFLIKKQLHDYTENLKSIKNILTKKSIFNLEDTAYVQYLHESINFYNKIIESSTCRENNCGYYTELQLFKNEVNDSNFLSLIKRNNYKIPCLKVSPDVYEEPCLFPKFISRSSTVSYYTSHGSDNESSNGTPSTIISAVGTIAGIFPILFVLYRKGNIENAEEETYNFVHAETESSIPHRRTYNIAYNASLNT
ncbi:PIR protein [Plasmodium ovale]|uniref:PIR protein n=1 Tax=Plasmodium ovale TaxID=36330 RepID=A0A1C3KJA4_PLAOA|nr:PIR protein [Plasmodium ovale]